MTQLDEPPESGFHRCTSDKVIDIKLEEKINNITQTFNGESENKKIGVSISFNKTLKLSRQEKAEILEIIKGNFPKTTDYLGRNHIDYFQLGSCGSLVTEATIKQINDLNKIDEIKKIEFASNDLSVYRATFKY